MKKLLFLVGLFASAPCFALNYYELEVYPYQNANLSEIELENATSVSNLDGSADAGTMLRSSFEVNYGITDRWEIGAYADFSRLSGDQFQFSAARLKARTRFFEKGELPVDLGAYAELEFPRGEPNTSEGELRAIIERDFGRLTVSLNPILEMGLTGSGEREPELKYAGGFGWRMSEWFRPHLDFFGELEPSNHLISPAVQVKVMHGMKFGAGLAFGLTDTSEQRLLHTKLEYEF